MHIYNDDVFRMACDQFHIIADYLNIDRISPDELARRRREFDEQKAVARELRVGKAA